MKAPFEKPELLEGIVYYVYDSLKICDPDNSYLLNTQVYVERGKKLSPYVSFFSFSSFLFFLILLSLIVLSDSTIIVSCSYYFFLIH